MPKKKPAKKKRPAASRATKSTLEPFTGMDTRIKMKRKLGLFTSTKRAKAVKQATGK